MIRPVPPVKAEPAACSANPVTTAILEAGSQTFTENLQSLSGELPVTIAGQTGQAIYTRFAPAMASQSSRARAMPWLLEQLNGWLQSEQISQEAFQFSYNAQPYTTHNIIAVFPGTVHPEEVVILSAHLDSISGDPFNLAPGAEDNAAGVAALMEAARLLRFYRFERTLKLVWFNAEEQGLYGSEAYLEAHPTENIVGVINLDMFGYDNNNDGCFELHVGELPQSQAVGQCFAQTIQSNSLPLTFDYLVEQAEGYSDHETFWNAGIGAVEVLENYSNQFLTGGCVGMDRNPYYHKTTDYSVYLNLPVAFEIARAGMAAAANLAGPVGTCYDTPPEIQFLGLPGVNRLQFIAPEAGRFLLERSTSGCSGEFTDLGSSDSAVWLDGNITPGVTYAYRLQVVGDAGRGYCLSAPICQEFTAPEHFLFLPVVTR